MRLETAKAAGFNEARANCAGNFQAENMGQLETASFNEARANCAGNCIKQVALNTRQLASMRPAQIAREIQMAATHTGWFFAALQ